MTTPPAMPQRGARLTEIVATALELLETGSWEQLSMRTLASELGIKAPSLYKHVANKEELRVLLLSEGLLRIGTELHLALAEHEQPGADRLSADRLLASYRQAALRHPNLYQLATSGPLPRAELPQGLEEWAGHPFWVLTQDAAQAQALWAFAHGMVVLELAGRFPPGSDLSAAWQAGAAHITQR